MKCPHCGMNLRDDITECGYCGGKIPQKKERAAVGAGKFTGPRAGPAQKGAAVPQKPSGDPDMEGEEEGGLSAILQSGEQVLIGSLNVSVKKFSFHAYLTNQRIFLIDTQEKKLKVTAKDVPRDTITGSIVEISETSDPVLVLSIRSGEEDVKTMKLVFVQNGTDRSAEIDEWTALLNEEERAPAKKPQKRPAAAPRREPAPKEEPDEEAPVRKPQKRPAPAMAKVQEPISGDEYAEEEPGEEEPEPPIRVPERARPRPELQPAKRPVKKDHERQPPVKRLVSLYNAPEEEAVPEEEPEVPAPPRRVPVKQVIATSYEREIPPTRDEEPVVRKPDVQSAMRVAVTSAIRQTGPVTSRPVRKTVIEPAPAPLREEETGYASSRRPVVQESRQVSAPEKPEHDEIKEATPQFCHNCGKKLPHSANFCPGCGTKLNAGRTLPHARTNPASTRKMTRTDPPGHEHRPGPVDEEEIEEEKPVPTRPPVKKAPKGSEMTILHKFLRR